MILSNGLCVMPGIYASEPGNTIKKRYAHHNFISYIKASIHEASPIISQCTTKEARASQLPISQRAREAL